jgi:capsular exopolysaccharide synthesis family protein
MRPFDYLRILQRRWWIPMLGLLMGLLLAFVTQPSEQSVLVKTAPRIQYRARHLLISNPTATSRSGQNDVGFDRLALLTIAGPVRDAALKDLKSSGWPTVVEKAASDGSDNAQSDSKKQGQNNNKKGSDAIGLPQFRNGEGTITIYGPQGLVTVAPVPDPPTGALAIVATGGRISAPEAANAFAKELLNYLDTLNTTNYAATTAKLASDLQLAKLEAQNLNALIAANANNPGIQQPLFGRLADAQRNIDDANRKVLANDVAGPDGRQLTTLEAASPDRLVVLRGPGGSTLSASQRMIVGGGIGLLGGLVLLIVMELLGARIRDVAGTEGAARMPVIAEIPVVKMNRADRFVVSTASDPASLTAEAYRSLRTSLLAMWQRHPKNVALDQPSTSPSSAPTQSVSKGRPLRSLLVTSPGPAEGKSISVVNLAAAFAETGMTVLIIDADFRRPTQYRYLDRPRSPNLGDLDITCTAADLDAVLQDTDVPGVRLAASAPNKADPGHSIAVAKAAGRVGQELADIVIIDSPPLLLANDASDIALSVDASILLARSGWTRRSGITASADLLRRLEAPVIGIVIVGAEHGVRAGYYGYYGYYGYGYGYAHPGEVSLVSKLLPWKSARRGESSRGPSAGSGASRRSSGRSASGQPAAGSTGLDDPWV